LEAAFGEEHIAIAMRAFFAQWEQAEETLTDDDVRILDNVIQKDRGPFLFWLVNHATPNQRREFGSIFSENPLFQNFASRRSSQIITYNHRKLSSSMPIDQAPLRRASYASTAVHPEPDAKTPSSNRASE